MGKLLWKPSEARVRDANMTEFIQRVREKYDPNIETFGDLWQWSVTQIPEFWKEVWDYGDVIASEPPTQIIDNPGKMPGAKWFSGARLNFAENLLRYRDHRTAIVFRGEDQVRRELSYEQLFSEVSTVAAALRNLRIQAGDRVAGFMPNMPESIIVMLAATSIGAIWSSCSPDFGINGVLDRFGQIKPRVLFTADGYFFKGKKIDSLERIEKILAQIDSVEKVVVVPYTRSNPNLGSIKNGLLYDDFRVAEPPSMVFEQLPFDHPLYIMYSSGTTGLPKCMVQGAGGVLLQQMKEHLLHTDLKREDSIFYFTTCGWMMWNWLTSALSVGATVILYDGNPFHPGPEALWKMAEEEKITVFGTSAGYLAALIGTGLRPCDLFDLSPLKTLLSTGSPLSIEGFEFVYSNIKKDLQLASISGGTDINGCFALGNPIGPVYAGELQCRGLGMKVEAFDANGKAVFGEQGELVCTAPSPSMPIYFWDDQDWKMYNSAYFEVYPGVWRHGDYIEVNNYGGVVIYGRSDATLNPGGVRIGTAEIYRQVDILSEIEDSLVVGQNWNNDVRVVLFVKLSEGHTLDDSLRGKIKEAIRTHASPRHVPGKIVPVPEIPYTHNMKKVEIAVQKTIDGKSVQNKDALKNPEVLEFYSKIEELQQD